MMNVYNMTGYGRSVVLVIDNKSAVHVVPRVRSNNKHGTIKL